MNSVDIFCITFGLWAAIVFLGVGVVIGRASKDVLHGDSNNSICGDRSNDLCDCNMGDDLK